MIDGLIARASPLDWLVLLWALAAALTMLSFYWYRKILNPLAAAVVFDVVLPCAMSATAAYSLLDNAIYGGEVLSRVIAISALFALGVGVGCLVPIGPLDRLLSWPFRVVSRSGSTQSTGLSQVVFASTGLGAFVLMAAWGGGGLLWLQSPRDAYIAYRSGVGPLWALAVWCLMLWLITSIWPDQARSRAVVRVAIACGVAMLFGSKAVVLSVVLVALMHQHLRVRPLDPWTWISCGALLAAGFAALLGLQSGGEVRWQMYSREYVDTVCRAFQSTDLMTGDMEGRAFLSSLWGLVPRGLYPDKPFEYGVLLLHEQLFPGMAERGSTPGVAPWTRAYMDFGALGAGLSGFVSGRIRDAFYRAYRLRRDSLAMFVAYVQFSLWPFLLYASPLVTLALCWILAMTVRQSTQRRNSPAAAFGGPSRST